MNPKKEVIALRKKGKSYREIANLTGLSKSTISDWCKNLKLPLSAQKILERKNKRATEILKEYNQLKAKRIKEENLKIRKEAISQIRSLSKYELLLIGSTLYWCEGWKSEAKNPNHGICFVNSDPKMIKVFMLFLRKILNVPEEKIKFSIRIHPNVEEKKAINFWSKITKSPPKKFLVTHQTSRASQGKRPFNTLPYGTLKVAVHDRKKFQKIKGWIEGIIKGVNFRYSK